MDKNVQISTIAKITIIMNHVKVVAKMEFVYSQMGNVNYSKAAKKDHKMKLLANLNLIHAILVQTHKM